MPRQYTRPKPLCSFPGCTNDHNSKGLCTGHLYQQRSGKPLTPLRFKRNANSPPVLHYKETPCTEDGIRNGLTTPCHTWTKGTREGYGVTHIGGRAVSVHRYVWEQRHGPITEGFEIDHQCRNRACCNVDHLRLVTVQVNVTENIVGASWQKNAAKTHCPHGHPYDEKNTHYYGKGKKWRRCRACLAAKARRQRRRCKAL